MNNDNDMKALADALWTYYEPKVSQMIGRCVRFYRARVIGAASGGKITIQRPFDAKTLSLPYTASMASAAVGSQVTVFVFGSENADANNSVIVNTGGYTL